MCSGLAVAFPLLFALKNFLLLCESSIRFRSLHLVLSALLNTLVNCVTSLLAFCFFGVLRVLMVNDLFRDGSLLDKVSICSIGEYRIFNGLRFITLLKVVFFRVRGLPLFLLALLLRDIGFLTCYKFNCT